MSLGTAFWILFFIWLIFGFLWYNNGAGWTYGWGGNMALVMVLLFLLGWHDFGFILQGR